MNELRPKSLAEHRDYLYQMVRLKLFFLHLWLEQHPDESFSPVLRNRVDIYRKTDANPGPLTPSTLHFEEAPWLDMECAAQKIYETRKGDRAAFEKEAFEVFRPSIDARVERDYSDSSVLAHYQCGSLRHEPSLQPDGETMVFHIANSVQPHSIFDDPNHLPACFRYLLDVAEKVYGAKKISTHTWLNAHAKWLAIFPGEWQEHLGPASTNVQWHYGFWGQFISGRGTFNAKFGRILRETGRLPYYPRGSWCTIDAMRRALNR